MMAPAARFPFFDPAVADLRHLLRAMRRAPTFTLAVVLVLACGFAVSTAVFSTVRNVVLAPLPWRDPGRLVQIISRWPKSGAQNGWSAPLGDLPDIKGGVPAFADVAAYRYSLLNLRTSGAADSLYGVRVSANLLPMLGVPPQLGSWIPPGYDRPGNTHVLLLSDGLWHHAFHADPHIIGKTMRLDDEDYLILGVMPPGFNFPMKLGTTAALPTDQMQFWMPLGIDFSKEPHGDANSGLIARLRNGASLAQAQQQIEAVYQSLDQRYPVTCAGLSAVLLSLQQQTTGQVRAPLFALLAGACLILLLGCTNVAALLLARGEARSGELALRLALGATPARVAVLPILYGFLLCACGCLLGLPLAIACLHLLIRLAPIDVPRLPQTAIDPWALLFATALAFLCGALVGGVNALQILHRSPREVLSESSLSTTRRSRARLRSSLVVVQVALAVLLAVGAGLTLRTFVNLLSENTGYRPAGVLYGVIVLSPTRYPQPERRALFYKKVLDQLRAAPGITDAATSTGFPLVGQYDGVRVESPEQANGTLTSEITADFNSVSPRYLQTVGVRLLRGRLLQETDTAATPRVAVIDSLLAQALWPGQNPIGRRINTGDPAKPLWREVVGEVAPMHNRSLDLAPRGGVFVPFAQAGGYVNFIVLRGTLPPATAAARLRAIVSATDPGQGVFFAQSMPQLMSDAIAVRRFLFVVLAFFGAAAVFLSALGLYSLVSFFAASRAREVGIRMALGATRAAIASLVVSQGLRLTLLGVALGTLSALLLSRLLTGLLYGVRPFDLPTLLGAVLLLAATTAIAALIPAWRAAQTDPMKALRTE